MPPLAALLEGAYRLLDGLTSFIHPIAGTSSAALAILIVTGFVWALLVPVGVSQVKAEGIRRRLYPRLIELQRRHRKDPVTLSQKTAELYRAKNSSQFAGFIPALAQAPVLSIVYTLFVRTTIGGHGNALLDHQLFSAPLGGSFPQIGADGSGGILVYLAIFTVLAVVAGISRRIALRLQLAAALYLAASATWTLGERMLLRRWHRGGPERSAEALSTPLR